MDREEQWLQWAVELQAIGQAGLYYGRDVYDIERFERVREIAAEMLCCASGLPLETVRELFCGETGYQTPKLDSRAAIFKDDRILLVRENDGLWSLPGGWVDAGLSVKENTVKEAWEEAGVDVSADFIIAVQDRDKHNYPVYAYKIIKIFVMCTALSGEFRVNSETVESGYFPLNALPELSTGKNTREQIELCFEAHKAEHWVTVFD